MRILLFWSSSRRPPPCSPSPRWQRTQQHSHPTPSRSNSPSQSCRLGSRATSAAESLVEPDALLPQRAPQAAAQTAEAKELEAEQELKEEIAFKTNEVKYLKRNHRILEERVVAIQNLSLTPLGAMIQRRIWSHRSNALARAWKRARR